MYRSLVYVALLVALLTYGCGASRAPSAATPKEVIKRVPGWFEKEYEDKDFMFGKATATSKDYQLAVDKAKEAASADVASKTEVHYEGLTERFREEVGTGSESELLDQFSQMTRSVVSTTLTGLVVDRSEVIPDGDLFRAFVLMKYPIGAANKALVEKLRSQEHLWTRYRASEMSKQMDKQVEDYEQWKKEQGTP